MRHIFFSIFCVFMPLEATFSVLPSDYLVAFGEADAPYQVVEFISLSCPFCVECYNSDFSKIQKKLIDTGKVQWIFHPVPSEQATATAFAAIRKMSNREKAIFLDMIFEEAAACSYEDLADLVTQFSKKVGVGFDEEAETDFFQFLSSSEIDAYPTIVINGVVRRDLKPSLEDLEMEIGRHAN